MDIFENLENLNVSEECFDNIMDIMEEYLDESTLEDQKGKALQALKELRATYNAGRRHFEKQDRKLPGVTKKAERDFEEARSKVHDTENKIRNFMKTPEGEKAHEVFTRISTGNYKNDDDKKVLIDKHKEYADAHHDKVNKEVKKAIEPLISDQEKKRKVMADLRSNKYKDKVADTLNKYRSKVDQLKDTIDSIKG